MVATMNGWIPPNARKPLLIVALSTTFLAGGLYGVSKLNEKRTEGPQTTATSAAEPQKKAEPKTPEASPESKELTPTYAESAWFKQMSPELAVSVKKILETPDAKAYASPFFNEIHLVNEPRKIKLSAESAMALYKQLDEITNVNMLNVIASQEQGKESITIEKCMVKAKDETTGRTETCSVQENLGKIRKDFVDILVQALGKGEWRTHPPKLFSQRTISETYGAIREELIKKANLETQKK
jgi:hypothetical protein